MNILPNFNFDINFKCAKQKAIKTSVKKPLGRHRLDISKKEISKCISSGYTIKQISEIFQCATTTIYKYLKFFDLKNKHQNYKFILKTSKIKITAEELSKEIETGKSIGKIATIFKTKSNIILEYMKMFDLEKRYKSIQDAKNKKRKRITKEELSEMILSGKKNSEIAQYFNCTESTIYKAIAKFKLKNVYKNIHYANITEKELESIINGELSLKEFAKLYHCSEATIKIYLNKYNLMEKYRNTRNHSINIPEKELKKLVDQGVTAKEIKKIYNCSDQSVYNYLNKYGLMEKYKQLHKIQNKNLINLPNTELKEQIKAGKTTIEIAKHFNCSEQAVFNNIYNQKLMAEYTKAQKQKDSSYIKIEKNALAKEIQKGRNANEMGETFNCSKSTILNAIKRYKLTKEYKIKQGLIVLINTKQLINLIEKGKSANEIAIAFNCNISTIEKAIAELNLTKKYKAIQKERNLKDKRHITVPKNELIKYIQKNKTIRELAEIFNCSSFIINKAIQEYELEFLYKSNGKNTYPRAIDIPYEELNQKIKEGHRIPVLASMFGCSYSKIRRTIQEYKLAEEYSRLQKAKKHTN